MKSPIILFYMLVLSISNIYSQKLNEEFDLVKDKEAVNHSYKMETLVFTYALDGKIINREKYILLIDVIPLNVNETEYVCKNFEIVLGDSIYLTVPAMRNFSYKYDRTGINPDEKGQLFGIDHARFENLKDEKENPFDPAKSYFIYNSFIDFHSLVDVFAADMKEENGIEDLRKVGDNIIHTSAFSEPPVNLGSSVKEGSIFKNGKVTLALTGLSIVDEEACAIVHYDSGESSFNMIMEPMPDFSVSTVGSSHYFGDILVSLNSKWILKADLKEFVVSEVNMPSLNSKINNVIERQLSLIMFK